MKQKPTDYRNRIKALEYVNSADLRQLGPAVYAIHNTMNSKVYVGSTARVGERWRTHRKQLRAARHPNRHLQAAWNEYGETAFEFGIIERVPDAAMLTQREQYWMDRLQACNPANGYNLRPRAESSRGKQFTPEQRARLSAVRLGNKYALGTKQSQETIDKRREKLRGRTWTVSPERKESPEYQAWRERHRQMMTGRKHDWHTSIPEETRAKIGASVKKARAATLKVYEGFVDPQGCHVGPIQGLEDFCAAHGLTRSLMDKVYSGERRSHKGWTVQRG